MENKNKDNVVKHLITTKEVPDKAQESIDNSPLETIEIEEEENHAARMVKKAQSRLDAQEEMQQKEVLRLAKIKEEE